MDEEINIIKQSEKKEKFFKLLIKYKTILLSLLTIGILIFFSILILKNLEQKRKAEISDKYVTAIILIENNKSEKALEVLKEIIFTKKSEAYSVLSLFTILNKDLVKEKEDIIKLFDQVISDNSSENEVKNLLSYKKVIFLSEFANEKVLLEATKEIINSNSLWKSDALILLGDYFYNKKNLLKAKEFYQEALMLISDKDKKLIHILNNKIKKVK